MRILGVDPGSESTGYGLIESDGSEHRVVLYGAIKTQARLPFYNRLLNIYNGLTELLDREPADVIAVEEVFYAANVQSALKLGHGRGIVLLVAAQRGLPLYEYSPLEIKRGIVGYGRAEKAQVQGMVGFVLHMPEVPTPDDAADALAVAVCHAHRMRAGVPVPARRAGRRRRAIAGGRIS
jgi:crossover junction endodeoxyribonuclease RuvC